MKVIQINEVCGLGSTGSICKDIAEMSIKSGIDNFVYYGQRNSTYKRSKKFGTLWGNLVHNLVFTRLLGIHGYGSIVNTLNLIKQLKRIRPDIIHLHSLHTNYLNYPILYRYIIKNNIPVVMTLHDCYNFTGQCEHYVGVKCAKFKTGCGNCPFLHKTIAPSLFFDWSKWLLSQKRKWYERINSMTTVAVSKWLKDEASESVLAVKGHTVTYIYNWIDTSVFYPRSYLEKQKVKQKYSLNDSYKYILAVAAVWKKNTTKYKDLIELNKMLPEKFRLIVVGRSSGKTKFPDDIIVINYTENASELACLYSLAYAYIHVSTCDTFGKVIAEAMACGTPPIVYNSTACSEVAGGFGLTVESHDIKTIVSSLENLSCNTASMINFVRDKYDKRTNISHYINIYKEIASK